VSGLTDPYRSLGIVYVLGNALRRIGAASHPTLRAPPRVWPKAAPFPACCRPCWSTPSSLCFLFWRRLDPPGPA